MHDESDTSTTTRTIMCHGFTQNRRCLGPIRDYFSQRAAVTAPDLPGHGASVAPAEQDCPTAAAHLVAQCGSGTWFGYSLGGRIALHAALERPEAVDALILLGATAGITDDAERAQRRALDRRRAREIGELGVERFCELWLDQPLFEHLPSWARFMDERSSNTVEGLSASLLNAGTGSMAPLWGRLGEIEAPVLVLAGELDARFVAIGADMADAIGDNATFAAVPGAGHAAHLERPEETALLIESFEFGALR